MCLREVKNRLFLQSLYEVHPQSKQKRPLKVSLAGNGDSCGLLSAFEPQFALASTLVQIANARCFIGAGQRPPDTIMRSDLGSIRRQSETRIRTKERGDLLRGTNWNRRVQGAGDHRVPSSESESHSDGGWNPDHSS